MLLAVVADQRLAHRLHGRMASPFAMGGQDIGIALTCHDRSDDRHACDPGDVGHDMMQLQVHLRQRLLHVLNVCRRVIQQPLPLSEIGAKPAISACGRKLARSMSYVDRKPE
jgi:hypothetical protein